MLNEKGFVVQIGMLNLKMLMVFVFMNDLGLRFLKVD